MNAMTRAYGGRMPPRRQLSSTRALVAIAVATAAVAAGSLTASRAAGSDLQSARARLLELKDEFDSVSARAAEVRDRLEAIGSDIAKTERIVRRLARRMLDQRADAVALAQEIYMGGSTGGLEAVLSSKTLADIDAQLVYLQSSEESRSEVFEQLAADRAELEDRLDEMDAARAEAAEAADELAGLQSEVEERLAAQEEEVESIEAALDEAADRREARAAAEEVEEAAAAAEDAVAAPTPPVSPPAPPPSGGYTADWDAIAQCESGGRWHLNSTYDGGLQFHPDTWLAYGGGRYARYAYQATREQQIAIAEKVLAGQGPGAWPNCFVWA